MKYAERQFWSPFLNTRAARLSMCDDHGGEFWSIIPIPIRGWREARNVALDGIEAAIRDGKQPGEVIA